MIHDRPKRFRLFLVLLLLSGLSATFAAEPTAARATAANRTEPAGSVSSGSKAASGANSPEIQAAFRSTADMATKLFAATEDLKARVADRRVLPGGSPTKKAPFLLSQADDLDKQRAKLRAEIARIEEYKSRNLKGWGDDLENQLLEVQISEQSIEQNMTGIRQTLAEKRWWLLGH